MLLEFGKRFRKLQKTLATKMKCNTRKSFVHQRLNFKFNKPKKFVGKSSQITKFVNENVSDCAKFDVTTIRKQIAVFKKSFEEKRSKFYKFIIFFYESLQFHTTLSSETPKHCKLNLQNQRILNFQAVPLSLI